MANQILHLVGSGLASVFVLDEEEGRRLRGIDYLMADSFFCSDYALDGAHAGLHGSANRIVLYAISLCEILWILCHLDQQV